MRRDEEQRGAFEHWITAVQRVSGEKWFYARIAGASYPNDDGSSRQERIRRLKRRERLFLVPDPANKFSSRAVNILNIAGEQIGYLPETCTYEFHQALGKGKQWAAFVADTASAGGFLGATIAMLRMPGDLKVDAKTGKPLEDYTPTAEEISARQRAVFEDWLARTHPGADRTLYVKLRGVQKEERQKILLTLATRTELDVGASEDLTRVDLYTVDGEPIGYLDTATSRKVLDGVLDGTIWKAFAGPVGEVPSGKWKTLTIGLVRVPDVAEEEETLALAASAEPDDESIPLTLEPTVAPGNTQSPFPVELRTSGGWSVRPDGRILILALFAAYILARLILCCH